MAKQTKPFKNLSSKLLRFDLNKLFISIMQNRGLQTFIGDLQRDRLEFTGKDIDGNHIQTDASKRGSGQYGAYAGLTEYLKSNGLYLLKGKRVKSTYRPYKRVTLNQEGDFHKTIVGKLIGKEMTVDKDWLSPIKILGTDWGSDIRENFENSNTDRFFGFTYDDKIEIIEYIKKHNLLEIELKKMLK